MLLVALFVLSVATVPLAGGRLGELAGVRFRLLWVLVAALGIQVLIISVVPTGSPLVHSALHLSTYAMVGVFLVSNRRIPGLWLVGTGGAMNLAAIMANGGVMPVAPSTLAAAGLEQLPGRFANSAIVSSPNLRFLGDVFAVPRWWPLHNVFSVGDMVIVLGAIVAVHRLSGSRLARFARGGDFAELRRDPGFMRLWAAQAISNLGDWVYTLAVATTLSRQHGSAQTFALLFVVQLAPSAAMSALGGPLIDRFDRKRLMVAADVLRGAAVASLLFGGPPSTAHLFAVAFCLGAFGGLFLPSLQASLPNVVPKERLVAANAVVTTTFHLAVMIGPVLGGVLVGRLGAAPAFALNAASFGASALLLRRVRIPRSAEAGEAANEADGERAVPAHLALVEGARYILATPLVRGVMAVLAAIMVAAALKTPLEPLFVLRTLGRAPEALGLVGAAWGAGMVSGSLAAPALARRWPRERLLAASVAVVGVAVIAASVQRALTPVLGLWIAAGAGNGVGTVSYESLLQERVPDRFRGRVMGASEAILDGAFLLGALAAGAVGSAVGIRLGFGLSGAMFLGAAGLARLLVVPADRRSQADMAPAADSPAAAGLALAPEPSSSASRLVPLRAAPPMAVVPPPRRPSVAERIDQVLAELL